MALDMTRLIETALNNYARMVRNPLHKNNISGWKINLAMTIRHCAFAPKVETSKLKLDGVSVKWESDKLAVTVEGQPTFYITRA